MSIDLEKDEKLVRIINDHWMKYARPCFVLILLGGLAAFLLVLWFFNLKQLLFLWEMIYIVSFILVFLVLHWFFLFLFSEATARIILTNKRVIYIHQLLYFYEVMDEIAYSEVKAIRAETKGLLHNILKYGDVIFEPGPHISMIPHPNTMVKEVEQLMGMR